MENQKNFAQVLSRNKTIFPIEEEMLSEVKRTLEKKFNLQIEDISKEQSYPLYDLFVFSCKGKAYGLKINLSPDLPNFWKELSENNFNFHPKIIGASNEDDEFKFLCYELPKGTFLSDISNYPLDPKLKINNIFAQSLKQLHSTRVESADRTCEIFDSFLPIEASRIYRNFPVVDLFTICKIFFKKNYSKNEEDCGLCHFDLCPQNIIFTENYFKFINFEYAANANFYLELWLTKNILNVSDDSFYKFFQHYKIDLEKLNKYKDLGYLFSFAYFNSKIVSEYMTFGVRDPINLKIWINKSNQNYDKIAYKLFIEKELDNSIRKFYNLWK